MTYNNETGLYEFDEWARAAQWFVDRQHHLYIVPPPGMGTEMYEAPDNEISDALDKVWYAQPISKRLATSLGLISVPFTFRHFSEKGGYAVDWSFFSSREWITFENHPEYGK